jgi:hypothetical protein
MYVPPYYNEKVALYDGWLSSRGTVEKYFTISIIASEIWPDMRSVFGSEWHYKRGYCITTYINTNQISNSKRYTGRKPPII